MPRALHNRDIYLAWKMRGIQYSRRSHVRKWLTPTAHDGKACGGHLQTATFSTIWAMAGPPEQGPDWYLTKPALCVPMTSRQIYSSTLSLLCLRPVPAAREKMVRWIRTILFMLFLVLVYRG